MQHIKFYITNAFKSILNILKINYQEIYQLIWALILIKKPINSGFFLYEWESKYENIADPTCEEVIERINIIKNCVITLSSLGPSLLELGAGYGRITKNLVPIFNITSLEPDQLLFDELIKINKNSVKCRFQEIHKGLTAQNFDLAFSVRSLEYLNLIELIVFLRRLSDITEILICWENGVSIRRVALASFFASKIKVIKIELYT